MSRLRATAKSGFTLIELLVVMLIISVLIALLIPAVNSARQAARSTQSKNNLKQIGLAMNLFQSAKNYFPPCNEFPKEPVGTNMDGWSVHALLLPFLEQQVIHDEIDYTRNYNYYVDDQTSPASTAPYFVMADGSTSKLGAMRVPTYISPAEPRDEAREGKHYPVNYGMNLGTWFVYDPETGEGGNGAAYPNSRLRDGAFSDGLSSTLAFAEVKGWQPYFRNTGASHTTLQAAIPNDPIDSTAAAAVAELGALLGSPENLKTNSGHTEWLDGKAHQIGFTTVFGPNQKVLLADADGSINTGGTGAIDVDWTNWQEGKGLVGTTPVLTPTYAAVTARSYFPGVVNAVMMDGSVRAIDDGIHIGIWRAISTRNGKEKLPNEFNQN